ncbi:hypothetical protein [Ammoniphilus sp. 3BR4]
MTNKKSLKGQAPLDANPIDLAFVPKENETEPKFRVNEPTGKQNKSR